MGEKAETGRVDGSGWEGADTQREEEEEEAVRTEIQQSNNELERLHDFWTYTSETLSSAEAKLTEAEKKTSSQRRKENPQNKLRNNWHRPN